MVQPTGGGKTRSAHAADWARESTRKDRRLVTSGEHPPRQSPPAGEAPAAAPTGGWSQRWEWPWFRLVMTGGFTVFTFDDALHRDGLWRVVYGVACAFFLAAFLVELRSTIGRRRSKSRGM